MTGISFAKERGELRSDEPAILLSLQKSLESPFKKQIKSFAIKKMLLLVLAVVVFCVVLWCCDVVSLKSVESVDRSAQCFFKKNSYPTWMMHVGYPCI